jgi:hypothetical protein
VTGFVGQFGNDYQLSPRTVDDLQLVEDEPDSPEPPLANDEFKSIDGLIYPNPAYDQIFIKTNKLQYSSPIKGVIYSSNGKLLKRIDNITANNNNIRIDNLNTGIYIIMLSVEDQYYIHKLVKQ